MSALSVMVSNKLHSGILDVISNVDHQICNQQISFNSLGMTTSPGVENHSRGTFCA